MSNGTKDENQSQSGTDKPEVNGFDALATAMQEGKMDEVNRLMAVESQSDEAKVTLEEDNTDSTEDTSEEVTTSEDESKSDEQTESTTDESKEAAPAASTSRTDIESLEELRQKLHRAQSDAGRVPYLQRQLEELRREIRAQKARGSEDATQGQKPTTAGSINDVVLDAETQKHIDDLREADPVLAATIERTTKAAIFNANNKVDHAVTTITEEEKRAEDERFYIEQKAILSQRVPNHEQIFATPEWAEWKNRLTPGQFAMATSGYANEVEQAIYAFAADMQRYQNTQTAAPTVTHTEENKPSEVQQARERKVSQAAETKAPAAKATTPQLDEKAYFEQMYKEIGKKEHLLP